MTTQDDIFGGPPVAPAVPAPAPQSGGKRSAKPVNEKAAAAKAKAEQRKAEAQAKREAGKAAHSSAPSPGLTPDEKKAAALAKRNAATQPKTLPGEVGWANHIKPSALLVPKYIHDRRAANKTRSACIRVGIGVAALLAISSVGSVIYNMYEGQSKDDAVNAQNAAQAQVTKLQPIADYYNGLQERQTSAAGALQGDVAYGRMISDIMNVANNDQVSLADLSLAAGSACPGGNPFVSKSGLGCVSMQATASSPGNAAKFVTDIGKVKGLSASFANTYALSGTTTFPVTVNYDPQYLSLKYVSPALKASVLSTYQAVSGALSTPSATTPGATKP